MSEVLKNISLKLTNIVITLWCSSVRQLAVEYDVRFLETSAKTGINVEEVRKLQEGNRERERECACVCVRVCQRKTKDRADGMREKSAHCPRRDSNLYLWDTRP